MRWTFAILGTLVTLLVLALLYAQSSNTRVIQELYTDPAGERAGKVMLLTLPSGKSLPVNYLRDGGTVYAAADFPWWREIEGSKGRARVLIRGETLHGHIRVEQHYSALRDTVFDRLRPTAPRFTGTLIIIEIDETVEPTKASAETD